MSIQAVLSSKIILLLACARVLVQMPLHISILVVQWTATNLKGPNAHSRSNLAELARVVRCSDEHMVAHLDDVVDVLESHNSAALGLAGHGRHGRKQMLQDLDNSLTHGGGEALQKKNHQHPQAKKAIGTRNIWN